MAQVLITYAPLVILVVVVLATLEFTVREGIAPTIILASPTQIAAKIAAKIDLYLGHLWITLIEVLGGLALGVVSATLIAAAMASWITVQRSIFPLVLAARVVPSIAIVPVIIQVMGKGELSKILIAAIMSFFPMALNSLAGFTAVEMEKLYLARSTGASALRTFLKIRLPNAMPYMFAGFKLGVTSCVIGVLVAELMGPYKGLGYIIGFAFMEQDAAVYWGAIVFILAMGLVLFGITLVSERLSIPWHKRRQERR